MNKNFLWGSATASYQCEGAFNEDGRVESMWDHYLHEKNLENGDIASDHYHQYEKDIAMMAEGGQTSYRFSLAWPRIITDLNGTINQKGIEHYKKVFACLRKYNIEPLVTLYHWDLPQYLEELGGWQNEITCEKYVEYVKVCFENFKDDCRLWATFNEPRWFIFNGYFIGNYPPENHDVKKMIKGAFHVMYASALAVEVFRKMQMQGSIGIVHSFTPIDGIDDTVDTRIAMRNADNYCNNWVLDTAALGEIPIDLLQRLQSYDDISYMTPDKLEVIKDNTVDFIGLNYYARALVKAYHEDQTILVVNNSGKKTKNSFITKVAHWFEQVSDPNTKKTDWDTEIYPKGLYDGMKRVYEKYHKPIYITENGVGVHEDVSSHEVNDDYRISFMNEHINAIMNAMDEGVDVRGYYAWSTFDLYSWKNGVEKRYGLVGIDFKNGLVRFKKKSFYWYKEVIESNGAMIQREHY